MSGAASQTPGARHDEQRPEQHHARQHGEGVGPDEATLRATPGGRHTADEPGYAVDGAVDGSAIEAAEADGERTPGPHQRPLVELVDVELVASPRPCACADADRRDVDAAIHEPGAGDPRCRSEQSGD